MIHCVRSAVLLLIVLYAIPSSAYFKTDNRTENLRVDHTTDAAATQANNTYLIYDNYNYDHPSSFLVRQRTDLIYIEKIHIEMPLRLLKRNLIYDEESIDRMLAANLRLKNLLKEYRDLNQKKQQVIRDAYSAVSGNQPSQKLSSLKSEVELIDEARQKLEAVIENMGRYDNSNTLDRLQDDIIVSDALVRGSDKGQGPDQVALVDRITRPGGNDLESGADFDRGRAKEVFGKETKLPWIFEMFLKLIRYVMSNRIEILLYTMFAVIIGFIISLKAQK